MSLSSSSPKSQTAIVRRGTPSDCDLLAGLLASSPDTLLQRSQEELTELAASFFIAEQDGEAVGCCCLEVYSPKIAELRSVVVLPASRRQGIGKMLIETAIEEFRRLNIRQLLVVTSNVDYFKSHNFGPCLNEKYALFWNGTYR